MSERSGSNPSEEREGLINENPRRSGILLHPTSLPGPHGIGSLGQAACRFVDFLASARQTLWQIMPLGPVGLGNSPYAARSAFAGNPLLISLEPLVERGWLTEREAAGSSGGVAERAQYEAAAPFKHWAIGRAFERFQQSASGDDRTRFERFREQHRAWLPDYALFMALKEATGGQAWFQWEPSLVRREPAALEAARGQMAGAAAVHEFSQYLFFEQWLALKRYANEHGIEIVGDIPIFVAHDSADVWVHQDVFYLDPRGEPTVVAGVPPDAFSATGQRWGNPLYNWDRLAERGYDWWVQRFRGALEQVDLVRLDHFRGFESYWEVPAEAQTAERGRWVKGPGAALFRAVEQALGSVPVLVEDLGLITPEVLALRDELGYPGMKVLQFAFSDDAFGPVTGRNPYLPHNHVPNSVVYTGTHDNNTTVGWYGDLSEAERHSVRRYLAVSGQDIAWDLIRAALRSVGDLAIVPLQDVMALGPEARMNMPGQPNGNWTWRYREDQLQPALAERLAELTTVYGRAPRAEA